MIRSVGAQIGLLGFSLAILVGLLAGNSAGTILLRALLVMFVASAVGQSVGWAAKAVLREHLRRKKVAIDQAHLEALRAIEEPAEPKETAPAEVG